MIVLFTENNEAGGIATLVLLGLSVDGSRSIEQLIVLVIFCLAGALIGYLLNNK